MHLLRAIAVDLGDRFGKRCVVEHRLSALPRDHFLYRWVIESAFVCGAIARSKALARFEYHWSDGCSRVLVRCILADLHAACKQQYIEAVRLAAHDEGGAKRKDLLVPSFDDEGTLRILGNFEEGFSMI